MFQIIEVTAAAINRVTDSRFPKKIKNLKQDYNSRFQEFDTNSYQDFQDFKIRNLNLLLQPKMLRN